MRRNSNEKIIRLWTAVAVLTVALMFLLIAFGRQRVSRGYSSTPPKPEIKMNIAGIIHFR